MLAEPKWRKSYYQLPRLEKICLLRALKLHYWAGSRWIKLNPSIFMLVRQTCFTRGFTCIYDNRSPIQRVHFIIHPKIIQQLWQNLAKPILTIQYYREKETEIFGWPNKRNGSTCRMTTITTWNSQHMDPPQ